MASEIKTQIQLTCNKGGAAVNVGGSVIQDMAGAQMVQNTQIVTTSIAALSMGAITGVPAWVYLKNLDATNYIELSTDNAMANKFMKILPGGSVLFPPSSATIYVRAHTASCNVVLAAMEL